MDARTQLPKVVSETTHKPYWNTVTVALWGLQEYNRYVIYHRRPSLARARRAGDWLVRHQSPDGAWLYRTPFTYPRLGVIRPPWVAAQAQGNAISLLVRLHAATRSRAYLRAARRAATVFERPIADGGVRRVVQGHALYEGFPTAQPALPLEDFQLSLLGLYDLAARDRAAARLWRQGMRQLTWALRLYNSPSGTPWFDLAQLDSGVAPSADPTSAKFNAGLLTLLSDRAHSRVAQQYAARWTANTRG